MVEFKKSWLVIKVPEMPSVSAITKLCKQKSTITATNRA